MIETNRIEYKEKLTDNLEKEVVAFLNYKEAVINAIVHNDYTSETPPMFEIYDDRLEITSSGGLSIIKNKEKFFKGYSNPINREIMRIYKDLDMVEQLGSGMNRILSYYKKDIFIFDDDFLRMVFISNYDEIKTTQETTQETTRDKIVKLLKQNSRYTKKDLMDILNKGDSTIKEHLNRLKRDGIIKRIGSTKAGYWEVVDDE